MPRSDDSRLALLRAGEALFAERGVDNVSLREICRGAGHKNHWGAQYHFGSKAALVEALLERHAQPLQVGWLAAFTELDARSDSSLRSLAEVAVRSLVAKLDDPDGGRAFLELCAQLVSHPTQPLLTTRVARGPGAVELARRVRAVRPIPPALLLLRLARVVSLVHHGIVTYVRFVEGGRLTLPRDAFVEDLVDAVVALLERAPADVGSPEAGV